MIDSMGKSQLNAITGGKVLHAGALTMEYDQGFLRYIGSGDSEVLRMIYFALRNHNWDTMGGEITDEIIHARSDSFDINYVWTSTEVRFPFRWNVAIIGKTDSTVEFSIRGEALADVHKNRTGFCILHPIKECAGKTCEILDSKGTSSNGTFPKLISPQQPFKDILGMKWQVGNGTAKLTFEGDIFETEDQRNWTDDSYKTYCTPLDIPFPVKLNKGHRINQKIILQFNPSRVSHEEPKGRITLTAKEPLKKLPKIGLGSCHEEGLLTEDEIAMIKGVGFDHYRVEVRFSEKDWNHKLLHKIHEANRLNTSLELVLFFTAEYRLETFDFISFLRENSLPHHRLLLLREGKNTSQDDLLDEVVPHFRAYDSQIKIGAGTNVYFTELNRDRPKVNDVDFVSYSVNPQVHAFDDASLTETLSAQAYTVESAGVIAGGKPVYITPITLKPRFNPNATGPEVPPAQGELPSQVDIRQRTMYGACWTLGSLIHLAESGVSGITYFETVGWRGIMQGEQAPLLPDLFPASENVLFPMYHVFQMFLSQKDSVWIPLKSSHSLACKGIMFQKNEKVLITVANYLDSTSDVWLDFPAQNCEVAFVTEENAKKMEKSVDFIRDLSWIVEGKGENQLQLSLPGHSLCVIRQKAKGG